MGRNRKAIGVSAVLNFRKQFISQVKLKNGEERAWWHRVYATSIDGSGRQFFPA